MALVTHWKLDDNAASTTVVATVGTNGTLEGGDNTSAKRVTGPGGSIPFGLRLNGSDDAINISSSSLSFSGAFSVSAWCEWDGTLGRVTGRPSDFNGRFGKISDTQVRFTAGGVNNDFAVPSLGTANWCHLLVTRDGSNNVRCFVNAVESATGAISNSSVYAPQYLGRNSTNFNDGFAIAQVKVFDSDESANVASLYAEGVGGGGTDPHSKLHSKLLGGKLVGRAA